MSSRQHSPRTHFIAVGTIAFCGEEVASTLDHKGTPECEACVKAYQATGWVHPLPPIGVGE